MMDKESNGLANQTRGSAKIGKSRETNPIKRPRGTIRKPTRGTMTELERKPTNERRPK
jgi:hypothetical protein